MKSESIAKITAAVVKVMSEVKGMEKNSRVGSGGAAYNGTKDQDVKEVFNTALEKNGLALLPVDIEEEVDINRWTDGNRQKQSVFTKVKTKYLLMHTSGEFIQLAGYGHGVDTQDKSAGKATTYALKNCLLYTFLTPVGKIDDTDTTHSNDIETPTQDANWLDESHVMWSTVVERIQSGARTVADAQKQFKIRPAALEKLKSLTSN